MPSGVYKRTEEMRKNMSERMIGNHNNWKGEFKEGHTVPKEWREKISKANKGHEYMGGEKGWIKEGQKLREGKIGHKETKKHKEKISNALAGKMPKNLNYPNINWGNVERGWYNINGKNMFFRSCWEANYSIYLNFLVKQKQILKWEYESDVFVFEPIKFGTRSYKPDFKVFDLDGSITYHEVKGRLDARSKTKIKRMAKYYPNVKLIIIDQYVYKDIKNKIGKMLKFY